MGGKPGGGSDGGGDGKGGDGGAAWTTSETCALWLSVAALACRVHREYVPTGGLTETCRFASRKPESSSG